MSKFIYIAFAAMTVVGFAVMGIDKKRAKNGERRIREATLFLIAFLLGGVGTSAGMFAFRHKTKHWYFVVFMPLLAIANVALVLYFGGILS